jgi:hypothetical protein
VSAPSGFGRRQRRRNLVGGRGIANVLFGLPPDVAKVDAELLTEAWRALRKLAGGV